MLKNTLKKILNINMKLDIKRNSNLDVCLQKISFEKNPLKKLSLINYLDKIYPNNHRVLYVMCSIYHYIGDPKQFLIFNRYKEALKRFKQQNPINSIFLPRATLFGAFGNFYYLDLLLTAMKNDLIDKSNLFIIKTKDEMFTNKELYSYFAKNINIVDFQIFGEIEKHFSLPLGVCFPLKEHSLYLDLAANFIEINSSIKTYLKLSENHETIGKTYLKKMGLSDNDWFITLHVREGTSKDNSSYPDDFRNSNPYDYIDAIRYIIKQGGYVFRMGDKNQIKMPKITGLIDYAHSEDKNSILDIFLASKSKFCLGTSSGFFRVPRYFGVPVILTNQSQTVEYFSLRKNDIFIPKKFKQNGKPLALNQIFKYESAFFSSTSRFKKHNYSTVNNTSADIIEGIKLILNINKTDLLQKKLEIEHSIKFEEYAASKPKALADIFY